MSVGSGILYTLITGSTEGAGEFKAPTISVVTVVRMRGPRGVWDVLPGCPRATIASARSMRNKKMAVTIWGGGSWLGTGASRRRSRCTGGP